MLLKELLEDKKNETYANIEVYTEIGHTFGFHGDFVRLVADVEYDADSLYDYWNAEVIDYEEMDSEDYFANLEANSSMSFEEVEFDGYTLVIKIEDYEEAGFSNQLKAYRDKLHMSMKKIATELQIPYRTWQDWEREERRPSDWTIRLLFRELDRMVDDLNATIEEYEGMYWGKLKNYQKKDLLSEANTVDGRTGNNTSESECIVDLKYGLAVTGYYEDDELVIDDDETIYNPER